MEHVGIDVHKRDTQICVLDGEGKRVDERRIRTTRDALTNYFAKRGACSVLLESCGQSEWIARHIESLGHTVIVADPGYAPMYAHRTRRVKTDRRDAHALANALRVGAYRAAHRKSDEQRHVSGQLAVRTKLVAMRAQLVTLAQALLRRVGLVVPTGVAEKFLDRLKALEIPADIDTELAPIRAMLPVLNEQIDATDKKLEERARVDTRITHLKSVPGIGPITAAAFVAAIDDAKRFTDVRQVTAYLGLVPSERSSGEKQRRGAITKAGNSQLRSLLVQAALRFRRLGRGSQLHAWSDAVAARRGRKIAVVGLARRLARLMFAMLRDGTFYEHHATIAVAT